MLKVPFSPQTFQLLTHVDFMAMIRECDPFQNDEEDMEGNYYHFASDN